MPCFLFEKIKAKKVNAGVAAKHPIIKIRIKNAPVVKITKEKNCGND